MKSPLTRRLFTVLISEHFGWWLKGSLRKSGHAVEISFEPVPLPTLRLMDTPVCYIAIHGDKTLFEFQLGKTVVKPIGDVLHEVNHILEALRDWRPIYVLPEREE